MLSPRVRRIFSTLIGAILLFAGCGSAPETISVPLQDEDSPLAVVIYAAERSPDRLLGAEVLARAARGYADAGFLSDSSVAADAAEQMLESMPSSPETLAAYLRLAAVFSDIERSKDAVALLKRSVGIALTFTEHDRASAYVEIVTTALAGSDETRSTVRGTVDQVYIIEDPLLRAHTLAAIAEAYQSSGVGLSVIGLIQQAIPAVRSADDRYQRALLFARLAVLSHKSGETTTSESLIANTVAELDTLRSIESVANEQSIANTAAYLAAAGQREMALSYVSALSNPGVQIDAVVRIAATQADPVARRATLVSAEERAAELEPTSVYVWAIVRLANEHIAIGDESDASRLVDRATSLLSDETATRDDAALVSAIVNLQARLNRLEAASRLIATVVDPYIRGELLLTVASELISQRRGGEADDFLLSAFEAAGETTYLANNLIARVAAGFAANRSYGLAVRAIEHIDDPTLRLRAAAELGYHAVVLGGMRDTTREELRLTLSGR